MRYHLLAAVAAAALTAGSASAQTFDWKAHQGKTINFLSSNHPWANAVLAKKAEFEALTGIKVQVDTFQEAQMRQRLVTVLQGKSADVDLYMSLKSREGLQFANAGWYADVTALAASRTATNPAYDIADFSKGLLEGETFGGKLTGVPLNIEGPVLYIRKDIFARCNVAVPAAMADLPKAAAALKACDPNIVPFASRGAKGAIAYTFSNFLHNMGGDYFNAQRQSNMCAAPNKAALEMYAGLLKDHGPPGVVNVSFLQIRELYSQGRAAMGFESSNEFGPIMQSGARLADTTIRPLPPGPGGSRPTVIGWGVSVSGYSKAVEPAWTFVQWATSKEMQAHLATQGIAPPRVSVATSPDYAKWIAEQPIRGEWTKALDEMAKTGTSEVGPPMEQQPEARDILGEAIQKMILGQANVDQACKEIDEKTTALLAKEKR
jgi:multiple sugar transport system substrate-binding protein